MEHFSGWERYQSILCLRPDNMGDILMTSPAFRAIKSQTPSRQLTLLTSSAGKQIARLVPEVDDIIVYDVPWVKNERRQRASGIVEMADTLRYRQFDAAIIFTTYSQSPLPTAMLCFMAGIPRVLSYCHENPYALISCWVPDTEPLEEVRHEVERQLALVAAVGATTSDTRLSLKVPKRAREDMRRLLQTLVDPGQRWIVLHAPASEEKRQYDVTAYAEAMRELAQQGYRIILTGSPDERKYVDHLAQAIGPSASDLSGMLSLEELVALIAQAPLLVSSNTGPVHIAAATGTPVVVLYAMTNPQHTPWQVPSRVLYFPVPPELQSKNRFLQTFPGLAEPQATPARIVQSVDELYPEAGNGKR